MLVGLEVATAGVDLIVVDAVPEVIFSRAVVLACTGLSDEGERAAFLSGELLPPSGFGESDPLSTSESAEGLRIESDLLTTRDPVVDSRPLSGRGGGAPRPAEDDIEGCRVVREAGTGGGPMDVRTPAGRALIAAAPPREVDGVLVLEAAVLDVADPICFAGDFVGDY